MTKRGKWGSKIGFILAASGSAVGLGNIWRFPYTAGNNGGGLFVLIYLLSIAIIAFPILLAEISLGRATGKNPVGAFNAIKQGSKWNLVGYLGVITGVMILSFYSVVAGWSIGYLYKAITGKLSKVTGEKAVEMYQGFSANSTLQIILLGIFLILTAYVISRGVSGGIEKFSKLLMPLLFIILLLLLVRSLTLPGSFEGLKWYLWPKFSGFEPKIILEAMGQAFFSLSLGMGTMLTYGSYVSKKENLPVSAGWIAFFDTLIAILAGLIIFPAIFSQGMDPAQGSGIMFNILPVLFSKMPGGMIFGILFFLSLSIAALTSTISLLEVPVSFLIDEKKWTRKKATILMASITFIIGIPSALSCGGVKFLTELPVLKMGFLDLWNTIWGSLALAIGALFIALFVGYVWKTSNALKEITAEGTKFKLASLWIIALKYISPVLILLILIGIFI
jgi:NSS family neurotransmitter:Na+ symporter